MFNDKFKQLILIFLLSLGGFAMAQEEEFIEIRPKYRSKADRDHYNKYDLTGKRWGVWKIYNRDRVLISEIEYERGRKHGVAIRYHSRTGKPLEIKNYQHGKLDGPYEKYSPLGELLIEGEYTMGKKSGVWTYNYPSGTIRKTGTYVNNLKEGTWEFYDRKEELVKKVVYTKGMPPKDPEPAKEKKDSTATNGKKKKVVKKKASGGAPAKADSTSSN